MTVAHVVAIVVAGGSGERLGLRGGKQLAIAMARPILSWTLKALDAAPEVGLLVVVCHPDRVEEYRSAAIDSLTLATPVVFVPGGTTRQASVALGLAAVPSDAEVVVVHDGARPLVTPALVAEALGALEESDAAGVVVGYPAIDTLKLVEGGRVLSTPDRSRFWAVQTPQVFRADELRAAHASALADGFVGTDDSSLVERAGGLVLLIEGPRDNIKVTVAEDLAFVEAALRFREGGEMQ